MRCLTKDECRQWRRDHSRRREWKRQFTCITPLDDLPWFAQELVRSVGAFRAALLVVDVIHDADAIEALRMAGGEQRRVGEAPGHLIEANPAELSDALVAALANTVDVTVLFEPARIAVFADHDEYTTVFSSAPLGDLRDRLTQGGVKFVEYHRDLP
jgi:hypothetical protein